MSERLVLVSRRSGVDPYEVQRRLVAGGYPIQGTVEKGGQLFLQVGAGASAAQIAALPSAFAVAEPLPDRDQVKAELVAIQSEKLAVAAAAALAPAGTFTDDLDDLDTRETEALAKLKPGPAPQVLGRGGAR